MATFRYSAGGLDRRRSMRAVAEPLTRTVRRRRTVKAMDVRVCSGSTSDLVGHSHPFDDQTSHRRLPAAAALAVVHLTWRGKRERR